MHYLIILIVSLLLSPQITFGAEFRLVQQPVVVSADDTFAVTLTLRTDTDSINAIEGSLRFSPELALVSTRFEGSLVPLWIISPAEKEIGTVPFAGVLPGGYRGTGDIFTLVFKAVKKGTARLSFGSDTVAYKNDGQGTAVKLFSPELSFLINASSGTPKSIDIQDDTLPPEPFTPSISSGDPFGLAGPVLVFTTQDKNSGISHYDIARSYLQNKKESSLSWSRVESPYALIEGDSVRNLYIRAVDRLGNTRIAVVPPQEFSVIAFVLAWWVFIFVGVVGGIILFRRVYRH